MLLAVSLYMQCKGPAACMQYHFLERHWQYSLNLQHQAAAVTSMQFIAVQPSTRCRSAVMKLSMQLSIVLVKHLCGQCNLTHCKLSLKLEIAMHSA